MKTSSIPVHSMDIGDNSYVICTVEISTGTFRLRRVPKEFIGARGRHAGLHYIFSSSLVAADPGSGFVRFSNASPNFASNVYISGVDADGGNVESILFTWGASTSAFKGTLTMRKESDTSVFAAWAVTARVDNGVWDDFSITGLSGSGVFADGDAVVFDFAPTGNVGDTGPAGPAGPAGAAGAAGANGANGADGREAGLAYVYSTDTTATDPTAGFVKFDNTTLTSATAMYISETDDDANALAALLATWDDGTSTIRGTLTMRKDGDPDVFAVFAITGTLTDNGAWDTFSVTGVLSNGAFANNDTVKLDFTSKGDKGDTGATGAAGASGASVWNTNVERAAEFGTGSTQVNRGTVFASTLSTTNVGTPSATRLAGRRIFTSTTLNNSAFLEAPETGTFFLSYNVQMVGMIGLDQVTGIRSWIGFAAGTGATMFASTTTPAVAWVGFRFDSATDGGNWKVVTYDGANLNVTDTGVAASATNTQVFRIEWEKNGSEVRFYIDGVLEHTATLQLPASATAMRCMVGVKNTVGGVGTDRSYTHTSIKYYECHIP